MVWSWEQSKEDRLQRALGKVSGDKELRGWRWLHQPKAMEPTYVKCMNFTECKLQYKGIDEKQVWLMVTSLARTAPMILSIFFLSESYQLLSTALTIICDLLIYLFINSIRVRTLALFFTDKSSLFSSSQDCKDQ